MTSARPIPPHATVVRNAAPLSADLDGEVVVLSIHNGKYYRMNEVGSRIWTLVQQPISVAAIVDVMVREFEVERQTCHDQVLAFLRELRADDLVQISDEQP
jgi:hypothetical protein